MPRNDGVMGALLQAQRQLQEQLSKIEFDTEKHEVTINLMSQIVRTLEKIDQMIRSIQGAQHDSADGELSAQDHETLKEKVKALILKAARKE